MYRTLDRNNYIHVYIYIRIHLLTKLSNAIFFGDFQVIRSNVLRIITFGNNGGTPDERLFRLPRYAFPFESDERGGTLKR